MRALLATRALRQRGAGMVEMMVGVLIGLIVVLVIYSLLSAAEGYKRMTEGSSDAQITGLLAQYLLGRELANGGNGLSNAADTLILCANVNLRPIPVLITAGASNDIADSFVTMYSGSPHVVWPVPFVADAGPGAAFVVQSPNGFSSPAPSAALHYRVIAVNPATAQCEMTEITAASAPDPVTGNVTLTQTGGTLATYQALPDFTQSSKLINLGPANQSMRMRWEVWDTANAATCNNNSPTTLKQCQVMSTDLFTAGASRNPSAQNVVLLKVQYGINLAAPVNGRVDCWVPAVADIAAACPGVAGWPAASRNFTPAGVQAFTQDLIDRIVAVRTAIVVRSDEPDLKDTNLVWAKRQIYLFNCSANTNAGCPGRILLSNNVIQDNWRYRTYENVIPLRNAIFNALP